MSIKKYKTIGFQFHIIDEKDIDKEINIYPYAKELISDFHSLKELSEMTNDELRQIFDFFPEDTETIRYVKGVFIHFPSKKLDSIYIIGYDILTFEEWKKLNKYCQCNRCTVKKYCRYFVQDNGCINGHNISQEVINKTREYFNKKIIREKIISKL